MSFDEDLIPPNTWRGIAEKLGLSPRELEVAKLSFAGLKREAMARPLGCRPGTVRNHLVHLYHKAGVDSAHDLHFLFLRLAKALTPGQKPTKTAARRKKSNK